MARGRGYTPSVTRSRPRTSHLHAALIALAGAAAHTVLAQGRVDASAPGAVVAEPSTETSIGVRWPVVGDRNLNSTIMVAYRSTGAESWSEGYPLFRTFNDRVSKDNAVPDGHLFAGSIFDLEPGT